MREFRALAGDWVNEVNRCRCSEQSEARHSLIYSRRGFFFYYLKELGAEAVTPIAHLFDYGDEGATKFCQLVLGVTAHRVDYALFHHAILHKFAQLLRDDPFTGLEHCAVYFAWSPRAAKQFIYDVRFPLAAHYF